MISPSLPCLENCFIHISGEGFIPPLHLNYNGVCVDIFVNLIMVSILLCLCMLYNLIFGYTSYWYFVLYLPCAWVVPTLHHCYICVYINLVVKVISMVTEIYFCNSYGLILGCVTSC